MAHCARGLACNLFVATPDHDAEVPRPVLLKCDWESADAVGITAAACVPTGSESGRRVTRSSRVRHDRDKLMMIRYTCRAAACAEASHVLPMAHRNDRHRARPHP